MTYEEMGAALKAEREKRNLNIEDVANELKISPRQLRALENGDMEALPHPAYARGFLRSYANWLGIGTPEMLGSLAHTPSTPLKEKTELPEELSVAPSPPDRKHGKGLVALIIICLLGVGGYYAWNSGALAWLDSLAGKKETQEERQPQAGDSLGETQEEREPERAVEKETAPAPTTPSASDLGLGLPPVSETVAPEPVEKTEAPAEPGMPEQHKLIITATEECWVHSNADKTDTRQFSLRKGDTFALTFANTLELKLGNAGGVRLRYDGADLPAPGASGQVRTITFPPKNNS